MLDITSASVSVASNGLPYVPNPRAARFNRPKVQCVACGYGNRGRDLKWAHLCEDCGNKIRRADAISTNRAGIQRDMMLADIPVRLTRGKTQIN